MKMAVFGQEEFFEHYEFHCRHMLALSGVQPLTRGGFAELTGELPDPDLELSYTPSSGYDDLREAVAARYPGARKENVLITVGTIEALLILTNLLIDPGDEAITLWPGYQPLHEFVRGAGGVVRFVPLEMAEDFRIDLDRFRAAITDRTRLVIVNSPHNPTGQTVPVAELQAFADEVAGRGITVLVDEIFRRMWRDDERTAWDGRPNLFVVTGLSKSFGLPGLRIGWLLAPPDTVVRARQFRKYTSLNPGALDQRLALVALAAEEALLGRTQRLVGEGAATALRWLRERPEIFEVVEPTGGGMLFPRLLLDVPVHEFCVRLVESTGVLLGPGSDCYDVEEHFRMGFATPHLADGLAGIDEFLARR